MHLTSGVSSKENHMSSFCKRHDIIGRLLDLSNAIKDQ